MNGLVIAPAFDSGGAHPKDASGAFIPCARAFSSHYDLPSPLLFDNRPTSLKARFNTILDYVSRTTGKLDCFAAFSHGWHNGCQWGLEPVEFARALAPHAAKSLTVCLYACSCGEDPTEIGGGHEDDAPGAGDGSIADLLRDALNGLGVKARVLAHSKIGHTARNPYVRVFDPGATAGGEWLVSPKSALWHRWAHAMQTTNIWERMPFMTRAQIELELKSK